MAKIWPPSTGVLLVGHGTRDASGAAEFFQLADLVARLYPDVPIQPCFLEICSPSIAEGMEYLAERGITQVTAATVLLFAAGHAKRDIPEALSSAARVHGISVRQTAHLGCHPALRELSLLRLRQALEATQRANVADAVLVMVGRGSHDASATQEMHEYARALADIERPASLEVCFVAMAKPRLQETLTRVAESGARCAIIQPHLLFSGALLTEIVQTVKGFQEKHPATEWIVTPHLGPHTLLAMALADRAGFNVFGAATA